MTEAAASTPANAGGIVDLRPRPLGSPGKARTEQTAIDAATRTSSVLDHPGVRTGASLAVVLSVIFVLALLTKRLSKRGIGLASAMGPGGPSPAGILEVLGRYPLSRGHTLILLKLDRRVLLLSQTSPRMRGGAASLTTLCELNEPEDVASILMKVRDAEGDSTTERFRALLEKYDDGRGEDGRALPAFEQVVRVSPQPLPTEMEETPSAADASTVPEVLPFPTPAPDPRLVPAPAVVVRPAAGATGSIPISESFGSIRQRLQALRGEAHR